MNRELKFKGQPTGKGGIWMVGIGAYKTHAAEHLVLNAKGDSVEVVRLCQYTGLKDKNGKEIYEGDILRLTGSTSNLTVEVVYNEEDTSFVLKLTSINEVSARTLGSWLSLGYECAIIGNVYDNPELMKGGRLQ